MSTGRVRLVVAVVIGLLSVQALAVDAPPGQIQADLRAARSLSRAFEHVAGTVGPAVVNIRSLVNVPDQRDFFGHLIEGGLRPLGVGSGVIVSPDGYVLTNNHVVAKADVLRVSLPDGRQFDADIVGTDSETDLAVIKIHASGLVAAELGDSDDLHVGDWVLAMGSPFGFANTVTAGIVSAKARSGVGPNKSKYQEFIQTDAAINPGNSGGPLVNLDGKVVGINSVIATRSGGSVGIGFAIPAVMVRSVMDSIIRTGRVARGWLGVSTTDLEELEPDRIAELGVGSTDGVLVASVIHDSPAQRAGIQPGDVITAVNGSPVPDARQLVNRVALTAPGTEATLRVIRDGHPIGLRVVLGDLNDYEARMVGGTRLAEAGLIVKTVDEAMLRELGYRSIEGVAVLDVESGSPADEAGLQPSDVIVAVNGQQVRNAAQLSKLIERADLARGVKLWAIRGGRRGYVILKRAR